VASGRDGVLNIFFIRPLRNSIYLSSIEFFCLGFFWGGGERGLNVD